MLLRVSEWDNVTYYLTAGSELDLLKILNLSLADNGNIIQYLFKIDAISFDSMNYSNSYFNFTIIEESPVKTSNYSRQESIFFNMYCDFDGKIKQQKVRDFQGDWAKCQNNYECESNLCSSGECIEAVSLFKDVKAFFVKMICKLSNPLSADGYSQCVSDYSA